MSSTSPVPPTWRERIAATLTPARLRGMRRGLEKESLRAQLGDGRLALTPHPAGLGSALTHPHITTDYSESQLELITGVHPDAESCLQELRETHQFTVRTLAPDEMLWASSMPCKLPPDEAIPIGRYGNSNVGRAKTVYRLGLAYRYGRRMQTISGIHYNWSLPGLGNAEYFALIRNFRRQSFLLLYLFGASPCVCGSFVAGREHPLQMMASGTAFLPHATSLRMGKLGYQSEAQASLAVSYNSLESYAASLHEALTQPYPAYETLGLRGPGGDYQQLSTSLLQIENEFYGTIRPKRVIYQGERPLHALRERGVEYVEVRCMDLDPFEPLGIAASTLRFIDLFLLHCLLSDSVPDSPAELAALGRNQDRAAMRGREPGLTLEREGGEVRLVDWAAEILEACGPLAERLDRAQDGEPLYQQALDAARAALADPATLPSARVLDAVRRMGSYPEFVRQQSLAIREGLLALPYPDQLQACMRAEAAASMAEQARIESGDSLPFERYLSEYMSAARLG